MSPRLRVENKGDRDKENIVSCDRKGGLDWVTDLGPMISMSRFVAVQLKVVVGQRQECERVCQSRSTPPPTLCTNTSV